MARTKKELLRLKSGVTSDFRCLMEHVAQRGVKMTIASHGQQCSQEELTRSSRGGDTLFLPP